MTEQTPAFSEILKVLRAEESGPTYSALSRWQERYPEYHDDLEDYFAQWATASFQDPALDDRGADLNPNQRWLADFGVAYATQIMRRQEAGVPDNRIEPLNDFEQLVLTAMKVQRTPRWQYLDRITDTVRELSNHHHLRSSVRETLKTLEARHPIFSWSPDPEKYPDEIGRQYFFLSSIGQASLKKSGKAASKKP